MEQLLDTGLVGAAPARLERPPFRFDAPPERRQRFGQEVGTFEGIGFRARGTFEVKLTPQASGSAAPDSALGRLAIDKHFHGDLEGTSRGESGSAP